MSDTLGDALPREQERVRNVLSQYEQTQHLCPQSNCHFAIAMIKQSLKAAELAAISGDVVAMIAAYQDLKEIDT